MRLLREHWGNRRYYTEVPSALDLDLGVRLLWGGGGVEVDAHAHAQLTVLSCSAHDSYFMVLTTTMAYNGPRTDGRTALWDADYVVG